MLLGGEAAEKPSDGGAQNQRRIAATHGTSGIC